MLNNTRRIVVKIGSSLLIDEAQGPERAGWMCGVAEDISALIQSDVQVAVVTSGAVAFGRRALGRPFGEKPKLEEKQALAACGQSGLMQAWNAAFASRPAAQVLLTAEDSIDRRRYLNARGTLELLMEWGVVPIINENDTVATQELKFGDNDRLSARVAQMISADALVILSDIDGLYTADPRKHKEARFIGEVRGGVTPEIEAYAGSAGSSVGTGGMMTKLLAAKIALSAGCNVAIARGTGENPLRALAEGGRATWFYAAESPMSARKRWIAGGLHPAGALVVDAGAEKALLSGKSLLPSGVTMIEGEFSRGDALLIKAVDGRVLGRGLSAYSAEDARRIRGRQTQEIETILGFKGRGALIHRDDLTLE